MPTEDLPRQVVARREYAGLALSETDAAADPFTQFGRWFADAVANSVPEADAFCLATASASGHDVGSRMVLLKGWDERGFVFCTNYTSRKGLHVASNPRASLTFRWTALERQVCAVGAVRRTTAKESDAWWALRPRGAQLAALASAQSSVIPSRLWLDERVAELDAEWAGREIPRPAYWGGLRVVPTAIEFWQGRPNRLHDRLRYTRRRGGWTLERLAP